MADDYLIQRTRKIKLLLMDCDGVLTDGRLYFSENGEALKVFDTKDGQGLVSWHRAGFSSGIITGRGSENIIRLRAEELGIRFVRANSADKLDEFEDIISELGITAEETAFIGDDIGDLGLLGKVGLSIGVADSADEVLSAVMHVTKAKGGRGAVREVIDLLLKAKA